MGIIWTPKPSKITPPDTLNFGGIVSQNVNSKHEIEVFPPKYYNSHDIGQGLNA